jgi:hypothetical protein
MDGAIFENAVIMDLVKANFDNGSPWNLALLNDRKHRNHIVGDINLLDQDDAARVGGDDQEMKVLNEMNELQQFEEDNWSKGRCEVGNGK